MDLTQGWVKLWRKMLGSVVSTNPTLGHVWVQLLVRANFARRQLDDGQYLEAGQLVIGQSKFAADIGVGRQQLRTAIEKLKKCENITSKPTSKGTLITIVNWEKYQHPDGSESDCQPANQPAGNQRVTSNQPAGNQRVTTEEEVKKGRIKEGKNTRGAFKPPLIIEVQSYCEERGYSVDPEAFVDHYASQGWLKSNGRKVVDWKSCLRTWAKNEKKFAGSNGRYPDGSEAAEVERQRTAHGEKTRAARAEAQRRREEAVKR